MPSDPTTQQIIDVLTSYVDKVDELDLVDEVTHYWMTEARDRLTLLMSLTDDYYELMLKAYTTVKQQKEALERFAETEKQLITWLEGYGWTPQDFINAMHAEKDTSIQ